MVNFGKKIILIFTYRSKIHKQDRVISFSLGGQNPSPQASRSIIWFLICILLIPVKTKPGLTQNIIELGRG